MTNGQELLRSLIVISLASWILLGIVGIISLIYGVR